MANYTVQGPDGSQHIIAGPEGASDQEVIAQAQKLFPGPSMAESFGRGIENNFPLANQAIAAGSAALGDKSYSQNLEEQNAAIKASKAANPVSYDAGAVTGAVAPLAIPGVGEALEGAPVLGNAALGAAQAVSGTDVVKQPEEALKQAAIGAGIGGTLGKILPSGEGAAQGVEDYANRKTVEASGLPAGLLNKPKEEIEQLGQTMHDMGLDSGSIDDKVNTAGAKLKEVGDQIGIKGLNAAPLKDPTPFVDALHQHLADSAEIYEQGSNSEAGAYRQALANIQQPGLNFQKLQQLKSSVGDRAFDGFGNVKNDALANVYGVYKDAMKSIVDDSGEYQGLMNQYRDLLDINGALGKIRGAQNAGGMPAKGFGLAGKMGAMVTGGNVPATVAGAAMLGPAHPFMAAGLLTGITQNPGVMSTAAREVSEAIPMAAKAVTAGSIDAVTSRIMNTINSNPQSLGKFAQPLIQAAQSGGNQGIAATHFLLSQQYPEYNSLIQKKEEDETQR